MFLLLYLTEIKDIRVKFSYRSKQDKCRSLCVQSSIRELSDVSTIDLQP